MESGNLRVRSSQENGPSAGLGRWGRHFAPDTNSGRHPVRKESSFVAFSSDDGHPGKQWPRAAEPELNRYLRFEVAHQRGARAAAELAEGFEHVGPILIRGLRMKGQMVAVEQASIAKKCNIQFQVNLRTNNFSPWRLRQPFGPEALFSQ
jgi:hypothetical protein